MCKISFNLIGNWDFTLICCTPSPLEEPHFSQHGTVKKAHSSERMVSSGISDVVITSVATLLENLSKKLDDDKNDDDDDYYYYE